MEELRLTIFNLPTILFFILLKGFKSPFIFFMKYFLERKEKKRENYEIQFIKENYYEGNFLFPPLDSF
jgi:hypothetical protein